MREILFRGKAKSGYKWISEGEWIEGSLLYSDDENGTFCQIAESYLSSNKNEPVMAVSYEVDPKTVCQYTSKTDKNGKKIFEHDIVNTEIGNFEVYFDEDLLGYALYDGERKTTLATALKLEVIGNIFDNPELIGDQP